MNKPDVIVVGAGFFGLTIAERVANEMGLKVLILEKRNHIGGNAYSYFDSDTGIEVHKYGSHLFHTSNEKVWEYVRKFSEFNSYRHTVYSKVGQQLISMPINLMTLNQIFGQSFSPLEARKAIEDEIAAETPSHPDDANLESKAIRSVGRTLYEKLIKGYTSKQWQTSPTDLPASVITRLPIRFNFDNRYFSDKYEGLPVGGYGALFNRMVSSPNIDLRLEADYFDSEWKKHSSILTIYTGPIDKYFNYSLGDLNWRTLDFEMEHVDVADFQGCAVVNYPELDVPYTRIHEFQHMHPERKRDAPRTIIAREISRAAGRNDEPYYPVNSPSDRELLLGYRALIERESNVIFGGRLGSYQYLDMHMAIASALSLFDSEVRPRLLA
jgi:UDP-galactopyranose mutase